MDKLLIEEKFKNHDEKLHDHEKRIDELENTYNILQQLVYRIQNVEKSIDKLGKKLDETKYEKSKKWDKLIDYLFYFVVGAILGYIALHINLK